MELDVGGSNPPGCTKIMKKKISRPPVELPAGFVDRKEKDLVIRDFLIKQIRETMTKYGFEYLETPSFEYSESLGKFLPDKDRPSEGVFSFEDGKNWLSLRYDLTAPLARYSAKNFEEIPKPFKRYQIGTVWRNEKPGPGRFREFLQFDADFIGTSNLLADSELCVLASEILNKCGLEKEDYKIKISNRKLSIGLLNFLKINREEQKSITLRAIDKLDRVGMNGVKLLLGKGRKDKSGDFTKGALLTEKQISKIIDFLSIKNLEELNNFECDDKDFQSGLNELKEVIENFKLMNFENFKFDATVVRGLEYYTGIIFEVLLTFKVKNEKKETVEFGAVGGGGRYDNLVKRFKNQECPATGISFGLDRLLYALRQKNIFNFKQKKPVLILVLDKKYNDYYFKVLNDLRRNSINSEIYSGSSNFKSQMKYADKKGCRFVIICGEDEIKSNKITIKDLDIGRNLSKKTSSREEWKENKNQKTIEFSELINFFRN